MSSAPAPFHILPAEGVASPVIASIPHTGNYIPPEIADRLASDTMRLQPMTDWHLHHLYSALPSLGITVIHATWSRFVADLNRPPEPGELYPGRFETGIVPMQTFWGDEVWAEPPDAGEQANWKARVHTPYHAELKALLDATVASHGRAILIDCHSVRSVANLIHDELTYDVYLGDRGGQSCDAWLTDTVDAEFSERGLSVTRNDPYKGGYNTRHYGAQGRVEALQIEMCQRVYMDEADPATALGETRFAETAALLEGVFGVLLATVESV